jgi:hypothetical protein
MEEPKSYSIEKLNESNYRSWSQVVESHLDDQDLWEVVQGNERKPERPSTTTTSISQTAQTSEQTAAAMEEYETKLEAWTKKAKKAQKMIISTISLSVMTYVEGTKDPAEMWTILEGRYKPKSSVTLRQPQCQCASQLCTTSIQCSNQHSRPGRRHVFDYHQQVVGRISEVSRGKTGGKKDGTAYKST